MSTLINTKITINKPIKNKCFGYTIMLDKKEPNRLLIKAKSSDGRGRGIAGVVEKNGTFSIRKEHQPKLLPLLKTHVVSNKVDTILDFAFGVQRIKSCHADKNGFIQFLNVKKK